VNLPDFYRRLPDAHRPLVKRMFAGRTSADLHAAADVCEECGLSDDAAYWRLAAAVLAVLESLAENPLATMGRKARMARSRHHRTTGFYRVEAPDRRFQLRAVFLLAQVRVEYFPRPDRVIVRWFLVPYSRLAGDREERFEATRRMSDWLAVHPESPDESRPDSLFP
jgi:hypothetical protein